MDRWNRVSHVLTHFVGSKAFFGFLAGLVVAWGVEGVALGPSRTWELEVTCGVPILTLLMVVVLQHAQNRNARATELKLNELILALEEPDNRILRAGRLGDQDLAALSDRYADTADDDQARDLRRTRPGTAQRGSDTAVR